MTKSHSRTITDMLTSKQAAEYLGVALATLRVYVHGRKIFDDAGKIVRVDYGELEPDLQIGRSHLFRRETLDAYRKTHPAFPQRTH